MSSIAGSARRNHELSLLILSLLIGLGAIALVALARRSSDVSRAMPMMITLFASYVAAHLVTRRFASQGDPLILPLVAILNGLGLAVVYRLAPNSLGPTQSIWVAVGIAAFMATLIGVRDSSVLARFKYTFAFAGVFLLLLPLSPLGENINGARLWVGRGSWSFQPGELAKLCFVIFFAAYLAERKELLAYAPKRMLGMHVPDLRHFGPLLLMWALSLLVMFYETDLGSSLLFFAMFVAMLYIATARAVYLALGAVLFAIGAVTGYLAFAHVQVRVAIWLHTFDPKLIGNESYQLAQGLFSLATGGLFGTGLGQGRPDIIPAAATDFIYNALGEELGLMGTAAVLVCFMLLVGKGLYVALRQRTDFGQLLAAGLATILGLQTFIIMAGVTRLLPLTGITLPFMSYGGSSMVANFILVGLLVRLSHERASAPPPAHTEEILIGGRR